MGGCLSEQLIFSSWLPRRLHCSVWQHLPVTPEGSRECCLDWGFRSMSVCLGLTTECDSVQERSVPRFFSGEVTQEREPGIPQVSPAAESVGDVHVPDPLCAAGVRAWMSRCQTRRRGLGCGGGLSWRPAQGATGSGRCVWFSKENPQLPPVLTSAWCSSSSRFSAVSFPPLPCPFAPSSPLIPNPRSSHLAPISSLIAPGAC